MHDDLLPSRSDACILTLRMTRSGESYMGTNSTLYTEDFYTWCLTTAELIRAGKWHDIDADALAEEIESMARSEKRQMENRIRILVMHLLKWRHQPEEHSYHRHSWRSTINEQRD